MLWFQKEEIEHLSGELKSDFMLWFQKEEIEPLWRVKVRFHALVSKGIEPLWRIESDFMRWFQKE